MSPCSYSVCDRPPIQLSIVIIIGICDAQPRKIKRSERKNSWTVADERGYQYHKDEPEIIFFLNENYFPMIFCVTHMKGKNQWN